MKRVILVLALIIACSCNSFISAGGGKYQNDLKDESLRGKVRTCTSYYYNSLGKTASYSNKMTSNYDKLGNLSEFFFYQGGKKDKLAFHLIYKYDRQGRKVMALDQAGRVKSKSIYSFDSKHNLVETTFSSTGLSSRFFYNNLGLRDSQLNYDPRGNLNAKVFYKYDGKRNKIQEDRYNWEGVVEFKKTFKYNARRLETEEITYKANGSRESKAEFKYDDRGNPVMVTDSNLFYVGGSPMNKGTNNTYYRIYRYDQFDKTGNWLQRDELIGDKVSRMEKRQIKYYK